MINLNDVRTGDTIKCIESNPQGYTSAQYYQVKQAGWSGWDAAKYADIIGDYGNTIEISLRNAKHFESVK